MQPIITIENLKGQNYISDTKSSPSENNFTALTLLELCLLKLIDMNADLSITRIGFEIKLHLITLIGKKINSLFKLSNEEIIYRITKMGQNNKPFLRSKMHIPGYCGLNYITQKEEKCFNLNNLIDNGCRRKFRCYTESIAKNVFLLFILEEYKSRGLLHYNLKILTVLLHNSDDNTILWLFSIRMRGKKNWGTIRHICTDGFETEQKMVSLNEFDLR